MAKRPVDPVFSRRPNQADMQSKLRVFRVPPQGTQPLIVLSGDTLGAYTHYTRGRTKPCPGDNCSLCDDSEQPRWRGYLVVTSKSLAELRVLELTPAVMPKLDEHFREHRTLRGAIVRLTRKNGKPNGELWIEIQAKPAHQAELPQPPNLTAFLRAMWGMSKQAKQTRSEDPPKIFPAQEGPDFGDAEVA